MVTGNTCFIDRVHKAESQATLDDRLPLHIGSCDVSDRCDRVPPSHPLKTPLGIRKFTQQLAVWETNNGEKSRVFIARPRRTDHGVQE